MDKDIRLLTNKEAAEVLRRLLSMYSNMSVGRANGKTMTLLRTQEALMKAIYLLEHTEDMT